METRFTLGPWSLERRNAIGDGDSHDVRSGDTIICGWWNWHDRREMREANAHLIAAAPELYSVTDRALAIITRIAEQQRQERGGLMDGPACNTAEYLLYLDMTAALRKAKGETQ